MRILLVAAAAATLLAVPASAQRPRPSDKVREMAPALDRSAEALLNVDLGPLLDAIDPGRPHPARTLRDIAGRGDPDFDRRLHASIYGNAERIGRAADGRAGRPVSAPPAAPPPRRRGERPRPRARRGGGGRPGPGGPRRRGRAGEGGGPPGRPAATAGRSRRG